MISTELMNAGIKAKAGQLVRIIDLTVGRQFGAWDDLQGLGSGATFSDILNGAVARHHGKAGVEFLEHLTRDNRKWGELLERFKQKFNVEGDAGQERRVVGRFALIALAGELATEYGVTGWQPGEATEAAKALFRVWLAHRQHGNKEPAQIMEAVAAFIQRHGDSRFSNLNVDEKASVRDRAGWYEQYSEGRVYWFTPDGLQEALRGFDFKRSLTVLVGAGVMPDERDGKGERAKQKKIWGQNMRLYKVFSDKLI